MLTRLKVSGFKNLVDVDVRFGPFTCIGGANATGKSNLFDAIRFLSALADRPLMEAALSVRDAGGKTGDVRDLFHRVGENCAQRISFAAEMVIPSSGFDDLGQQATASITFVRYSLTLGLRPAEGPATYPRLELLREELAQINKSDAARELPFPHSTAWRNSAIQGPGRRGSPFISTEGEGRDRVIRRHQEGRAGRTLQHLAANLPRTVLSVVNAAESPTALLARREMQCWRLLQLEPAVLRQPDDFTAPPQLGSDGSHLPATLYHLAWQRDGAAGEEPGPDRLYAQVANRLAELIDDVYTVDVDRDERRQLLTLMVTGRDCTTHAARSLSDGTLRFMALAVMERDPETDRLLCLEEPENGIHPERIPAMLRLLQDISVDAEETVGPDNPLRQVVVNTHSPAVVAQVRDDSLLVAELKESLRCGQRFQRLSLGCLPDTWRSSDPKATTVSRGRLLAYLNPVVPGESVEYSKPGGPGSSGRSRARSPRRVVDRADLQPLLPFPRAGE